MLYLDLLNNEEAIVSFINIIFAVMIRLNFAFLLWFLYDFFFENYKNKFNLLDNLQDLCFRLLISTIISIIPSFLLYSSWKNSSLHKNFYIYKNYTLIKDKVFDTNGLLILSNYNYFTEDNKYKIRNYFETNDLYTVYISNENLIIKKNMK